MKYALTKIEHKHITFVVNALVFFFFISVLAFKKGYSYAPMILAGMGIIYLFLSVFKFKQKLTFSKEDKWLIFAFLFYFATFALSALIHGDGFREIDNPSRVLLFLPLLLLFKHFPIHLKTILYGIPAGAIVAGLVAVYQKFGLNLAKPFPYLMHIQAGDMAISLAMMSLAIAVYWGIQQHYKWMALSIIGAVLGVLASALTGARGGWVGLPIILGIIFFFAYRHLSKKVTLSIGLILTVMISGMIIAPQTKVKQRIDIAYTEIVNYVEKNHRHTSLGARFDMWNGVLLGIKEKPILGWGSKGYIALKEQQVKEKIMYKNTLRFNDAHNQYLDALIKRGFFGLLGVLFITVVPLVLFIRAFKQNKHIEHQTMMLLGIIHIVSVMCFFTSQTFLAHNSGFIFYLFFLILPYSFIKKV